MGWLKPKIFEELHGEEVMAQQNYDEKKAFNGCDFFINRNLRARFIWVLLSLAHDLFFPDLVMLRRGRCYWPWFNHV